MSLTRTKVSCFWKNQKIGDDYRTAVSLHGHTRHSKEGLTFIPKFTAGWPVLDWALKHKCSQAHSPVDFNRAYWTPPLTAERAFELEKNQIENVLGRASIVSLTDHDNIDAPLLLQATLGMESTPISLEWSVPFEGTIFHFGVHNLPPSQAQGIMADLAAHTKNPSAQQFKDLSGMLNQLPGALIVFNHPLWDLCGFGPQRHAHVLNQFLDQNMNFFHAFELNGMRNWKENRAVTRIAEQRELPIISGGDRHGCEPSAVLNLTSAATFAEFAEEIRVEQRSHVLFMPQYAEPMGIRRAQVLLDVIREYPDYPRGSRRWDDRVFHPDGTGDEIQPLSALWGTPPVFLERIFSTVRMWEDSGVRRTMKRVLMADAEMHLPFDSQREAAL